MSTHRNPPLSSLFAQYRHGQLNRRQVITAATVLGMSASVATFCANALQTNAHPRHTPAGSEFVAQDGALSRPTTGTEDQERGAGGQLRLLQWQAPSHLSPHTATGNKEWLAASPVLEPLMFRLTDGSLVPNLITEVPTVENGLLAEDLTSVTYELLPDVTWSDGEPFTAEDVRFTWEWVMDVENASTNQVIFEVIEDIEVVDELSAHVIFTGPTPAWAGPHTGTSDGSIYPRHVLEGGAEAHDAFRITPVGTGPFVVEDFTPNDQVAYVANERYREPTKPYFSEVLLTGGGDPVSAARAVVQTGEYDYAWNTNAEPDVLTNLESEDSPGTIMVMPGDSIERIHLNFADPDTEVDGEYAHKDTPHPAFSDPAVREALVLAIDREMIAEQFYFGGDVEPAEPNIVAGIPSMYSENTSVTYDPERAAQLLEEAGWTLNGDVREKDGEQLTLRYQTTINQLRQRIQALVSANLEEIGFGVELIETDASVFFDGSPGNEQNMNHFYADLQMYTSNVGAPPPLRWLQQWYAGPDDENIAQAANDWTGANFSRYRNPEFDELYRKAEVETDPERAAELFIQLNDILIEDDAVLPLVRAGKKCAVSRRLREENLAIGTFEFDYWNIANWNLAEGSEG